VHLWSYQLVKSVILFVFMYRPIINESAYYTRDGYGGDGDDDDNL